MLTVFISGEACCHNILELSRGFPDSPGHKAGIPGRCNCPKLSADLKPCRAGAGHWQLCVHQGALGEQDPTRPTCQGTLKMEVPGPLTLSTVLKGRAQISRIELAPPASAPNRGRQWRAWPSVAGPARLRGLGGQPLKRCCNIPGHWRHFLKRRCGQSLSCLER